MRRGLLGLSLGLFLAFSPPASADSDVIAMMGYGLDARAERDQNQNTLARGWHSVIFGAGYKPWMLSFEYSTFSESSGNDTLSVARKTETALLWFHMHTQDEWAFRPYIGVGLGGYREGTDSTFYMENREDQSAWTEHVAGSMGLRWAQVAPLWVSLEGRIHSNRYLDPSPMLSALLRIGFVIE